MLSPEKTPLQAMRGASLNNKPSQMKLLWDDDQSTTGPPPEDQYSLYLPGHYALMNTGQQHAWKIAEGRYIKAIQHIHQSISEELQHYLFTLLNLLICYSNRLLI